MPVCDLSLHHLSFLRDLIIKQCSLGNFLPEVAKVCFATSIGIAYSQWMCLSLKKQSVTVEAVDSVYDVMRSLLFLCSAEMFRKLPVNTILALMSLYKCPP